MPLPLKILKLSKRGNMKDLNLEDCLSLIDLEVQALQLEAKAAIQAIQLKHKNIEDILIRVLGELEKKGAEHA